MTFFYYYSNGLHVMFKLFSIFNFNLMLDLINVFNYTIIIFI